MLFSISNLANIQIDSIYAKLALANITGATALLFLSLSVLTSVYGIKLIDYLKLETKFPRLAKFIRLRNKLQIYSIVFEIILMYFVLFGLLFINILALIPISA